MTSQSCVVMPVATVLHPQQKSNFKCMQDKAISKHVQIPLPIVHLLQPRTETCVTSAPLFLKQGYACQLLNTQEDDEEPTTKSLATKRDPLDFPGCN
ncbi:unnamed protein product [Fusarium graminearum]|uniref:Chromosome 4, complete genome n=1 Tax=Gibberella zeae (strain ATCC MYA-4620 / CBS 123657 / FGSC 9075 / NRRL 31084 / PH-1) TaxID=229533 RepID=A0A098DQD1_GIBZE|nr:unnamed protein product [Fusarium graminearum]CZS73283.1 unnamed protein product [Fusarium graminearum]